jgi:hypothetical protein
VATKLNRMTFAITSDIEIHLKELKKRIFYDKTKSEMLRLLVSAGIESVTKRKLKMQKESL